MLALVAAKAAGAKEAKLEDFLPQWVAPQKQAQSLEEMKSVIACIVAANGGL